MLTTFVGFYVGDKIIRSTIEPSSTLWLAEFVLFNVLWLYKFFRWPCLSIFAKPLWFSMCTCFHWKLQNWRQSNTCLFGWWHSILTLNSHFKIDCLLKCSLPVESFALQTTLNFCFDYVCNKNFSYNGFRFISQITIVSNLIEAAKKIFKRSAILMFPHKKMILLKKYAVLLDKCFISLLQFCTYLDVFMLTTMSRDKDTAFSSHSFQRLR